MGSDSDWDITEHAVAQLTAFGASGTRQGSLPSVRRRCLRLCRRRTASRGLACIIAGACGRRISRHSRGQDDAAGARGTDAIENINQARIDSVYGTDAQGHSSGDIRDRRGRGRQCRAFRHRLAGARRSGSFRQNFERFRVAPDGSRTRQYAATQKLLQALARVSEFPVFAVALRCRRQADHARHLGIGVRASLGQKSRSLLSRSAPQKSSPPIASVGTPKTPRAIASSVFFRNNASLTSGDAIRATASGVPALAHELGPLDRQISQATVAPDEREIWRTAEGIAVRGDRESQQRQRIERMRRGKLDRDSELRRLPTHQTVGTVALPRFRRNLVSMRQPAGRANSTW